MFTTYLAYSSRAIDVTLILIGLHLPCAMLHFAEHGVQGVWRRRSRSQRQRDDVPAGDNIENAQISQTPLQRMFGGCGVINR